MDSLATLHAECWDRLEEGAAAAGSPFHTGVLGTTEEGAPRLRTVVLRSADRAAGVLICHTDVRSAKVRQLEGGGPVAWLFYDPERRVQLRVQGTGTVHRGDRLAAERWSATSVGSRRCYLVEPGPGTVLGQPGSTLPPGLRGRRPLPGETAPGLRNFAVITARVELMDRLELTADGHRRARFRRRGDGWERHWIAP